MAKRKNHGRASHAGALATAAVRRIVPDDRLRLTRLQVAWSEVAPGRLREVTWPAGLSKDALCLHVSDNQWLHELTYMRADLLARIERICPEAGVGTVRLRVGRVPPPAPPAPSLPDPRPMRLGREPDRATVNALQGVEDPDLRQAMATARLALTGQIGIGRRRR